MKPDFSNVSYVTIYASDFENTLRFYEDVLGLKVIQSTSRFAMLDTKPVIVNLHEGKVENKGDATEVSFYVDDLEEAYLYLKGKGVEITREPMRYPDGPSMFNCVDPEGNAIGIVERVTDPHEDDVG